MTYYDDPLVTLLHGDCIEVMATLPADSVDAIVTDPPYGLEFMGKEWDRFGGEIVRADADSDTDPFSVQRGGSLPFGGGGKRVRYSNAGAPFQAWCEQWGREALRVTRPGGYLLSFGGTRTHHRLVCALEDAGWIIRDELDWIYASGFPKGKANLKPAHEPIVLARKPGPLRPLAIDECRIGYGGKTLDEVRKEAGSPSRGGTSGARLYEGGLTEPHAPEFDPSGRWPSNVLLSDPELFDEPNPYVVGSGATATSGLTEPHHVLHVPKGWTGGWDQDGDERPPMTPSYGDSGGYSRFFIVPKADRAERERGLADRSKQAVFKGNHADNPKCLTCNLQRIGALGAAACSCDEPQWAEVRDTERANVHPTVKPIDLMRHLVRLVTPHGGTVLDPFLGSGTTCLAASELGVRSIGIEREAEYLEIAKGRLIATPMGLGLDVRTYNPEEVA